MDEIHYNFAHLIIKQFPIIWPNFIKIGHEMTKLWHFYCEGSTFQVSNIVLTLHRWKRQISALKVYFYLLFLKFSYAAQLAYIYWIVFINKLTGFFLVKK
jgi:hypothetical protein